MVILIYLYPYYYVHFVQLYSFVCSTFSLIFIFFLFIYLTLSLLFQFVSKSKCFNAICWILIHDKFKMQNKLCVIRCNCSTCRIQLIKWILTHIKKNTHRRKKLYTYSLLGLKCSDTDSSKRQKQREREREGKVCCVSVTFVVYNSNELSVEFNLVFLYDSFG